MPFNFRCAHLLLLRQSRVFGGDKFHSRTERSKFDSTRLSRIANDGRRWCVLVVLRKINSTRSEGIFPLKFAIPRTHNANAILSVFHYFNEGVKLEISFILLTIFRFYAFLHFDEMHSEMFWHETDVFTATYTPCYMPDTSVRSAAHPIVYAHDKRTLPRNAVWRCVTP